MAEAQVNSIGARKANRVVSGVVAAFGAAPYENVKDNALSYFVTLDTPKGQRTVWGVDLERAAADAGMKVGDDIRLSNQGERPVTVDVKVFDGAGKQIGVEPQEVMRQAWEVAKLPQERELPSDAAVIQGDVLEAAQGVISKAKGKPVEAESVKPAAAPQPAAAAVKPLAALLDGKYVRNDAGEYKEQGKRKAVIVDEGDRLRLKSSDLNVFKASLELVVQKGWEGIEVSGDTGFKREAWFHARMAGVQVDGYEPNDKDLARLSAEQKRVAAPALVNTVAPVVAPTPHTIDGNFRDAVDHVLAKGGGVRSINLEQDTCTGPIVFQNSTHMVQHLGKKQYVVHDRSKVAGVGVDDEKAKTLRISYGKGKGSVEQQKSRSNSLER